MLLIVFDYRVDSAQNQEAELKILLSILLLVELLYLEPTQLYVTRYVEHAGDNHTAPFGRRPKVYVEHGLERGHCAECPTQVHCVVENGGINISRQVKADLGRYNRHPQPRQHILQMVENLHKQANMQQLCCKTAGGCKICQDVGEID